MTRTRSAEESSEEGTQRRPPEKLNFRGPRDPASAAHCYSTILYHMYHSCTITNRNKTLNIVVVQ